MADGGELETLRYSAFISYSHDDAPFARRLHRTLEGYRLPRRLSQESPGRGGDARRLRPIFRDRDELSAASDLSQAVQAALAESSALIVICSPHAARSAWVGREVALFRRLHAGGAILAALIDGEPDEAFPPALCAAGPGGAILQPLAADFRRGGDGARLALLKLVAVLAGVRLDELVQRDAHRRVRQATLAGAAALAGMAAMGALAVVAVRARNVAEQERNRGETLIGSLLTDLRAKLKGVGRLDLLDAANVAALTYYQRDNLAQLSASGLEQRSLILLAMGEDDEKRGKLELAQSQFSEAARTTEALLRESPKDQNRIFMRAQSAYWMGEISWRTGQPDRTETDYRLYVDLARQLVALAPNNPDWQMEMVYSTCDLGEFIFRHYRALDPAAVLFNAAMARIEDVARMRPGDPDVKGIKALILGWLGEVSRLRGDYVTALAQRASELQIFMQIEAAHPGNAETRADEIATELAIARVYMASKSTDKAIVEIDKARQSALDLAARDKENVDIARQVRILSLFKAEALLDSTQSNRLGSIAGLIGRCSEDLNFPNNLEQFDYCSILNARYLYMTGKDSLAEQILNSSNVRVLRSQTDLTERWGLDFPAEIRLVDQQIGVGK